MTLDEIIKSLCKGQYSSFSISYNDHACNYCSVGSWLTEYDNDFYFVSPEEKQKAIDTNSLWNAHWYPDTPVGFYSVYASSYEALIEYLTKIAHDRAEDKGE